MEWEMKLKLQPFLSVKSGQKTVELRLYDEKRKMINAGDRVAFTCVETGEKLICKVKNVRVFSDFPALYQAYDKRAIGYKEHESANPKDMEKYYAKTEIEKYGAVAIELVLER